MVSLLKNFTLTLTVVLAALTILPGAANVVEAKSLCSKIRQHRHGKHRHHHHHHRHCHPHPKHPKKHKHPKEHKQLHNGSHKPQKSHVKPHQVHKGPHRHHHKNATKPITGAKTAADSFDNLIPYGLKAGITGEDGLESLGPYIGSYSNWKPQPWSPVPPDNVLFMPMLWGAGHATEHDGVLLNTFRNLFSAGGNRRTAPPKVVLGFEEPDCPPGHGSAGTPVHVAAAAWNKLIAPLKRQGTVLASPSMCKQIDEDYLTPFNDQISVTWDVTNVHVNQDNVEDVKTEIDYYWNKYQRPIYVTEFACVSTNPWRPVTDQNVINKYINDVVEYFESDDRVKVYQYSTGMGLADQWRLTKPDTKELTESGRVYKAAIQKYAGGKASRVGIRRDVDAQDDADTDGNVNDAINDVDDNDDADIDLDDGEEDLIDEDHGEAEDADDEEDDEVDDL